MTGEALRAGRSRGGRRGSEAPTIANIKVLRGIPEERSRQMTECRCKGGRLKSHGPIDRKKSSKGRGIQLMKGGLADGGRR